MRVVCVSCVVNNNDVTLSTSRLYHSSSRGGWCHCWRINGVYTVSQRGRQKGGTNFVARYPTPHRPSMQHRVWPRDPPPQPRVLPGARPVPWPAADGGAVRERLRLDRCSLRRYPRHDSRATLRDRQRADYVDRSADPRHYTQEPDVAGGRPGGMASSRSASRRESRADVVVQQ